MLYLLSTKRMGDGAQIHIFELAARGHAARQPSDLQAARLERLADHMRRGFALGREIGGQDHLLHLCHPVARGQTAFAGRCH
jgi:hypothetical protein